VGSRLIAAEAQKVEHSKEERRSTKIPVAASASFFPPFFAKIYQSPILVVGFR
jgi:hypothetical protein